MAQVNVDLSEYDMLRTSKDKAEAEVKELKEEIKKLKENASNVVVKNRYYLPYLDYKAAARKLLQSMSQRGIGELLQYANDLHQQAYQDPFGRFSINENVLRHLTSLIEKSFQEFLNLKATYMEDSVTMEVRGFDEFATQIREKFELEYKAVMEEKRTQLEREIETYNVKHLDVDKAVKENAETLNSLHEAETKKLKDKIEQLEGTIKDLKEQLKEASKTSEERLAEAMAKLKAAEEEVAKYSKPKKRWVPFFK